MFLQPYTSKEENLTEIVNEVGVLAYILHLRCFTDWVTDTTANYNAGISLIFLVKLQIVFLIGLILRNTTLKAKLLGKKYLLRYKHWKAMKLKNEINNKKNQNSDSVLDPILEKSLVVLKTKTATAKLELKIIPTAITTENKIAETRLNLDEISEPNLN